jgi:plastocyanin
MPAVLPRPPFRRRLTLAVAAFAALAPVLAFVALSPARAASHAVAVLDGSFSPATLTIAAGDTVTWTNEDDSPHTVTSGTFDSGNLEAGATFSFTFTEPGTYAYLCSYHDEMQATIVVEPASAPAPAAPTEAPTASQEASGTAGGGGTAASHAAGHGGAQPDTALPVPAQLNDVLAPLLIGLGLVALAFGLVPMTRPRREAVGARTAGWRR